MEQCTLGLGGRQAGSQCPPGLESVLAWATGWAGYVSWGEPSPAEWD